MSDLPDVVRITEEGPREGFQADPRVFPTNVKLQLINALSRTGVAQIVLTSFVNPRRMPMTADAEEVCARFDRVEGVRYSGLWLNQLGLERAIATDRLDIAGVLSLCASEPFLLRNQRCSIAEHTVAQHEAAVFYRTHNIPVETVGIFAAFGCNFRGDIPISEVLGQAETLLSIARNEGLSPTRLALADTMGWATPLSIKRLVGSVRDRYPDLAVSLHLHDTRGMGLANAYAGLMLGVAEFDASVGGIGGCPFSGPNAAGNVCTEDLAFMCEEMGIRTGIDLPRLIDCARLAEEIFERPLPGSLMKAGTLAARRAALLA